MATIVPTNNGTMMRADIPPIESARSQVPPTNTATTAIPARIRSPPSPSNEPILDRDSDHISLKPVRQLRTDRATGTTITP